MDKYMDKYDAAVDYLTEHPNEILNAWECPHSHPAGCLFELAGRPWVCGCLTQVRSGEMPAATDGLTAAIHADERIPSRPQDITPEHLPVFAEWQRRVDALGVR